MSGAKHRRKGDRVEREIVELFKELGVHAERYPLSGASHFRDSGHDLDVYVFGRDASPWVAEVKARKDGKGFVQLETWLDDYDLLLLKRNNQKPMVVLPWQSLKELLIQITKRLEHGNPTTESSGQEKPSQSTAPPASI